MADQDMHMNLFHRMVSFYEENNIQALCPATVMFDLHRELNISPEKLFILSTQLIDGIYSTDNPFLYGERIEAVRMICEEGFYNDLYLEDLNPDDALDFLLHCTPEIFISAVDYVCKENQSFYTTEWDPELSEPDFVNEINASIQTFLQKKPSLNNQIVSAAHRAQSSQTASNDRAKASVLNPQQNEPTH